MNAQCPRCRAAMSLTRLGTTDAFGCERCRGVFLTHEHLEAIQRGRDVEAAPRAEEAAAGFTRPDDIYDGVPLPCAVCAEPMSFDRVLAEGTPVRIDRCGRHGVFFDAHELAMVAPKAKTATRDAIRDALDVLAFVGFFLG